MFGKKQSREERTEKRKEKRTKQRWILEGAFSLMIEGIKLGLGCEYRRQGDQPE
jgi:hypothetical protein